MTNEEILDRLIQNGRESYMDLPEPPPCFMRNCWIKLNKLTGAVASLEDLLLWGDSADVSSSTALIGGYVVTNTSNKPLIVGGRLGGVLHALFKLERDAAVVFVASDRITGIRADLAEGALLTLCYATNYVYEYLHRNVYLHMAEGSSVKIDTSDSWDYHKYTRLTCTSAPMYIDVGARAKLKLCTRSRALCTKRRLVVKEGEACQPV